MLLLLDCGVAVIVNMANSKKFKHTWRAHRYFSRAAMEPNAPPKYEPVVQQQPHSGASAGYDAYRAGYDQSGGGGGMSQVTVNMMMQQREPVRQQPRTWSTSLCGCCEDMSSCCLMTWCTPCYVCCSLSPRLGESSCAPLCLALGGHSVPMVFRTKLRAAHGITGGAIDDCCVSIHCPLCVMCQIKREVDYIERSTGRCAFLV